MNEYRCLLIEIFVWCSLFIIPFTMYLLLCPGEFHESIIYEYWEEIVQSIIKKYIEHIFKNKRLQH